METFPLVKKNRLDRRKFLCYFNSAEGVKTPPTKKVNKTLQVSDG